MAKVFTFHGKTIEELQALSEDEFIKMLPSRKRRSHTRGWTEEQQKFLKQLRSNKQKVVRTHCRDIVVLPEMAGRKIAIYNGKEYTYVVIEPEMVGHILGEYALTRRMVKHSAAGIGATRSTKFISVK